MRRASGARVLLHRFFPVDGPPPTGRPGGRRASGAGPPVRARGISAGVAGPSMGREHLPPGAPAADGR
jgi:hypothetical protein